MSAVTIKDLSKLCIHTITTKPWTLEKAVEKYSKKGIKGISVWRRVSANWLAGLVVRGIVELEDAHAMIVDMAYNLVKKAYRFDAN